MDSEIAWLKRQLEEERKLRQEAERQREEVERQRQEAERQLQSNSLFELLEGCHALSQDIQVRRNVKLTTQGDTANPTNRLFPHHVRLWKDFPRLQEEVWEKLNSDPAFPGQRLFTSNHQLDYVHRNIASIHSELSLRTFQRDTVDNFVDEILNVLRRDNTLRERFHLQKRVIFQDLMPDESIDASLEDAPQEYGHLRSRRGQRRGVNPPGAPQARRRNRRADQFCVQVAADELQIPVFAVEFKAPHKLTLADLICGLHEMDIAEDVIGKNDESFEFCATYLVAAVITQIFSYMVDSGVQYGEISTGEASIFLHIPGDPTTVLYFLSVPNQDVHADDDYRLHRTAVGQKLAFTLNAVAADPPTQDWHDAAEKNLSTWEVEFIDVLQSIPESIRKEPPPSEYKPLSWKPVKRSPYNTRSRASCRPNRTTPNGSSEEGTSGSDADLPPPSPTPAMQLRPRRGARGPREPQREQRGQRDSRQANPSTRAIVPREYCTSACIRGLFKRGPLDPACPNVEVHGSGTHALNTSDLTRRLHAQLIHDRYEGFEQLHIRGRTGFLLKACLLSHGYTVVIKAASARREAWIRTEAQVYSRLRALQGYQIPVCVGQFKPRIRYWYHGQAMDRMMILSWSGLRISTIINDDNTRFFETERKALLQVLRSYGVMHRDTDWRNVLWNDRAGCAVMIDFEDVTWLEKTAPRKALPKATVQVLAQ